MKVRFRSEDENGNKIPCCYKHITKLELKVIGEEVKDTEYVEYNRGWQVEHEIVDFYKVVVISHKQFTKNGTKYRADELKGFEFNVDKQHVEVVE
jgi:hypothetical protein